MRERLRLGAALALALLAGAAGAARAQVVGVPHEPTLTFTIYFGLAEGSDLWHLPAQALLVTASSQEDTVGLWRKLRPGLVAGLITTYYPTPNFGWSADVGYFGIGSEQRCDPPAAFKPDSTNRNKQLCDNAQGEHVGTNVVGILGGITYRFAPDRHVQPYVRLTVGPGLIGVSSFVETTSHYFDAGVCALGCTVPLLQEQDKAQLTWVVNLSAGMTIGLGPGYRARVEARDLITSLPNVTGPRDPTNNSSFPSTSNAVKHLPTLLFGLDIELEHRRTRRY